MARSLAVTAANLKGGRGEIQDAVRVGVSVERRRLRAEGGGRLRSAPFRRNDAHRATRRAAIGVLDGRMGADPARRGSPSDRLPTRGRRTWRSNGTIGAGRRNRHRLNIGTGYRP
ncbi:MAG: hypothetical protein AVDCRST_MAG19-274 [uncultured Thermomicrobiales bacterium]|uniref:Uncharacterized protein n=1 Tax=uncultured Thermomicrobiales bacterium TaxID=1645740 RepID=A0A6J4UCD7_9BACT|nr:MAG: hypothetical protein AVDCRST_MAG19-274 [uncultured Thermomicrobiales bacterium]